MGNDKSLPKGDSAAPNSARGHTETGVGGSSKNLFSEKDLKSIPLSARNNTTQPPAQVVKDDKADAFLLGMQMKLRLGSDKKRFTQDIQPVKDHIEANEIDSLTPDQKNILLDFLVPMFDGNEVTTNEAFEILLSKDKTELIRILNDYEALRTLATALKDEIKTEQTRSLMFTQQIRSLKAGMVGQELMKDQIINVVQQFIAELVPQDFVEPTLTYIKGLDQAVLNAMTTSYSTFRKEVWRVLTLKKQEREARAVKLSQVTKSWICGRKHKIVRFPAGFKRLDNGQLDKREDITCAHCKKTQSRKTCMSEGGFATCMKGCDTYMCQRCAFCPKKHMLTQWTEKPSHYGGVRCDLCGTCQPASELAKGYYRCSTCSYDVCLSCIPKATLE